jgi:ribosomal protein S18 acetylase RimI-like enzyme
MSATIRAAGGGDAAAIAALIRELAAAGGESSPVTEGDIRTFLATGQNGTLLAEQGGAIVASLTYSVHPGIFHGGLWGLIEELIVTEAARGAGIGHELMDEAVRIFRELGCREAGVTLDPDNEPAQHLYRAHGFVDESLLLERHFTES